MTMQIVKKDVDGGAGWDLLSLWDTFWLWFLQYQW